MTKTSSGEKRSFMTLFRMFWVAFAGIFCGVWLIWFPPADLVDEIPIHKEIGWGFLALGVLVFLAMLFKRMHSVLMFVACGAVALGCGWFLLKGPEILVWQMALTGLFGVFMAVASVISLVAVFTGRNPMFGHLKQNKYFDGDDLDFG